MRISRRTAIYGTMAVCAGLILIAEPLVSFFTGDPATHANALAAVYWTFPFYFLYSLNQVYIGGLKGRAVCLRPVPCVVVRSVAATLV